MPLDDGWMNRAACRRSKKPDHFFPEAKSRGRRADDSVAKTYCKKCRVRKDCLYYSIAHRINYGVWGGYNQYERTRRFSRTRREIIRKLWFRDHPLAGPRTSARGHLSVLKRKRIVDRRWTNLLRVLGIEGGENEGANKEEDQRAAG